MIAEGQKNNNTTIKMSCEYKRGGTFFALWCVLCIYDMGGPLAHQFKTKDASSAHSQMLSNAKVMFIIRPI